MPKVAIFLSIILLSSGVVNSYAIENEVLQNFDNSNSIIFDSGIVQVNENFFTENNVKRYLVFGTSNLDNNLIKNNSIYQINSDNGFFYVTLLSEKNASNLISKGYYVVEDTQLDFHSTEQSSDISRISQISKSDIAEKKYGYSGNGTTIAIVDTGVDFSNLDIQHSLARNEINHPIMFDPDGQGIILTNATFFAYIDENEIIRNYSKPIPSHMTSSAYVSREGVFLDVSQGGKGSKIPIYNSFFPQLGSSIIFNGTLANDMKIGDNNRDYIKSKSGEYHLGVVYQGALSGPLARIQVVPVLVVDSFQPGVYDTIIPDLSTSWEDYTRFDLKPGTQPDYDFDFTDEKPIVLGSGNEFLVYDSNKDGKSDYSAGTIGAHVLDVYGVIRNNSTNIHDSLNAINGTILPPLDPEGEFFGLMTDFQGHGTSSAASIVSRGHLTYDIYNDSKKHSITGVAPNAKIVPVKALWFGDTVYGWLWAAGFDNTGTNWKFSGNPRVDIISNSWGVSTFPTFDAAPGMDLLSLILSVLSTPHSLDDDYPGVTIISSAGNSGHGYGTIGLPNASPFGISVGATTNNVYVGYGPFKDQPRFGDTTAHYNHVVDFSSRGPSIIGDPKPDVMSIGAHGFTPSNVLTPKKDSKDEPISLFGGTSMAAPIVSGSAAIVIEAMKDQSKNYDPFLIKNILMSSATDLRNDPFTQGSGLVDVSKALDFVNGTKGVFIVHNDKSYENLRKILEPSLKNVNSTEIGFEQFELPTKSLPMTSWFAGQLLPEERSTTTFTIENPSNEEIVVKIEPQQLSLIHKTEYDGKTIPREQDSILNKTGTFTPNYIKLSDVKRHSTVDEFFDEKNPIPINSELMILNVNFPFDNFMNDTADVYADDLQISSLYLYDWIDSDNNTKISSNELSMVNRAGSWGTVQELRVSDPNEKFDGIPLVGVYPVPTKYSYWLGDTKINSTSIDYTLSASYYHKEKWSLLWTESESIVVPANDKSTFDVTLVTPTDLPTGVYQGFLNFESKHHTINTPVSFVSKTLVDQNDSIVILEGKDSDDVMYGNGYTKGAFDMVNRYMAGDWRQFYFDVQDELINSAAIELSWEHDDTNLSVFVMDPSGKIIQTNVPSGVFGHFLGWASLDWLGNSVFSQGGGFYPVKNKDDTSIVLYVPINQTGTYSILTHSTLFGGNSTTEPISFVGKFSNISKDLMIDSTDESNLLTNEISESNQQSKVNKESIEASKEKNEILNDLKLEQNIDQKDNDSFTLGVVIGIISGIAIGSVAIFLLRQKPSK
ncbi:S8 family serine peptidase [Nitrosopumilus sp.]|uniref:S8 family serine peptidase n=1 Tax=Nitrosopumilus sp. TaxID=2024843 RepID=UPI0026347A62|nr:S8 family serine peptidase [Nitrosopumilus sp.]